MLEYSSGFTNIANMMLNQTVVDPTSGRYSRTSGRKALEIAIDREEVN